MNKQKTNSSNHIVENEEISESLKKTMSAEGRKLRESTVRLRNNVPTKEKTKNHPRVPLSLELQLVIIKLIFIGKTPRNIAKELGISHTSVYSINRNKEKIIQEANELPEADSKIEQILKDIKYSIQIRAVEDYLNNWLNAMGIKGLPVSVAGFQAKSFKVYKELNGTYNFDPGYDWVCSFENRWVHPFLRDGTKNASDKNNFFMQRKIKKEDDNDQSKQDYEIDPEDASINDASIFFSSSYPENQFSIDCKSHQNTESISNTQKLGHFENISSYRLTFFNCIHLLEDPDVTEFLSNDKKEELKSELHVLISTMNSFEHLLNDLLINETWRPFGEFLCLEDVAWVCQLKYLTQNREEIQEINEQVVFCTLCCEKLKDSYKMDNCNKERKSHRLDCDFNLTCRTCSVCLKSTLHCRPAAKCIFCIILFWKIKDSLKSHFGINNTFKKQD